MSKGTPAKGGKDGVTTPPRAYGLTWYEVASRWPQGRERVYVARVDGGRLLEQLPAAAALALRLSGVALPLRGALAVRYTARLGWPVLCGGVLAMIDGPVELVDGRVNTWREGGNRDERAACHAALARWLETSA